MELNIRISDLNYKEHQQKKARPQGKAQRKKRKKETDPDEKRPSSGASSVCHPQGEPHNGKVLFNQALHTLAVCNWLLLWMCFVSVFRIVIPDISGLNNKYTQDLECFSQGSTLHSTKAGRTLSVLNKSMCLIPIARVNPMFYCTHTKDFTIKDNPQGTKLRAKDLQRQHPQLHSSANHWDSLDP